MTARSLEERVTTLEQDVWDLRAQTRGWAAMAVTADRKTVTAGEMLSMLHTEVRAIRETLNTGVRGIHETFGTLDTEIKEVRNTLGTEIKEVRNTLEAEIRTVHETLDVILGHLVA